ncbi:transposase [Micromonospora sp. WMMD980]|uniref:transposase n=1 Tax=Micromonospora sp. WMMD980 TaxID=3016088 RepID=UPI002417A359|nr:transposase [Micromonospora sp. WMMD980]MDG4802986.1 transposase [Micromonospora sp. WMMD980]
MALVRVYCGLASADPADRTASAGTTLTSAVVDDAGRLLHVCEIGDEPAGYARLVALLVERSGGPSGAAIAADSDDHTVTSLLSAAGRPLAIADDDSVDDFAERFADDDSLEEMQSPPAERRAVGLARALQAGALSAVSLPAPRDLAGYKQVLSAHAALASGRHSAAVTLREVLRELYPAALRAYPDPAEPVALAVLDALPEPSMLTGAGRGREIGAATDAVTAQVAAEGLADTDTVTEAVTALRVAISETPRRATVSRVLTAAVAETVRQAVASVRACDAGCDALVGALAERATPAPAAGRRAAARRGEPVDELTAAPAGLRPVRPAQPEPTVEPVGRRSRPEPEPDATEPAGRRSRPEPVPGGRRSRPEPVSGPATPSTPRPLGPPPVAPAPVAPPPVAPAPVTPVAPAAALGRPMSAPPSRPEPTGAPLPSRVDGPTNRPVSAPPPPPPGITPIAPSQRGAVPPAEAGEPFRPTLTTAAINKARAERQRTVIPPRPETTPAEPPTGGFSATDLSIPVPSPRPSAPEPAPPGSRANWPLVNNGDDQVDREREAPAYPYGRGVDAPSDPGRVTPPWLADDLPPEPPMLRLVEPPPLADRALRSELDRPTDPGLETPPLRLVDRGDAARTAPRVEMPAPLERRPAPKEHRPPPVSDEGDGDLLIFAQAKSAWFVGHGDEADLEWASTADTGWQAAEQAARPAIGAETKAGLPKRVPQANLVPGSPLREERPLRIVRNAASLAENTTGYFRGWRRGQEIGGFAVGGRPGREAAGGWDFSRDTGDRDDEREYEYRSAGYRS